MKRPSVVRHIIEISDGPSDPGAMLMRQAIYRGGNQFGDGDTTTAVLAQPMAQNALCAQVIYVSSEADLIKVAKALCFDEQMTDLLAKIFSIVGRTGL
ncbi:MAG: hypothetical protein M1546_24275 [Chloroflexi bacterium]|nr:hypothetical protein [Chloroflexota bacterium]